MLIGFGGCGGDGSSTFSGRWTVQLLQAGGVYCSDDGFLGVGSGTPTRLVSIDVAGGDDIGEEARLTLGTCTYVGTRVTVMEIEFISDDSNCSKSITLTEIGDSECHIFVDARTAKPDLAGNPTCTIDEYGTMKKNG